MRIDRVCILAGVLIAAAAFAPIASAADPDGGFSTVIGPSVTGEEVGAQEDLWALEVAVKPMRMIYLSKSREMVWYLVYRIVNRPLPKRVNVGDSVPVNTNDPPPPAFFVPRATLVGEDPDLRFVVRDTIMPEALAEIVNREKLDLKTSVQMAGPVPPLTPANAKKDNARYGVFMFRGVDPKTTVFTVYLSGFSSAYKIGKDDSGKTLVLRRTLAIPYSRRADEFDQFEKEIRQRGDAKWIYVPDEKATAARS